MKNKPFSQRLCYASAGTKTADQNIDVAGGYPHSIQVIGHHLVEVDTDGHVAADDWKQALQIAATELARKDFLEMCDFNGKGTLRETVLNILALTGPLTTQQLREAADGKNIYNEPYMGTLKKSGAVKELQDGTITLHSMLFRAAILIHLYTHASSNPAFQTLIKRFAKNGDQSKDLVGSREGCSLNPASKLPIIGGITSANLVRASSSSSSSWGDGQVHFNVAQHVAELAEGRLP